MKWKIKNQKIKTIFVICSTSGDGVPPSDARPFYEWIMSNPVDLKFFFFFFLFFKINSLK